MGSANVWFQATISPEKILLTPGSSPRGIAGTILNYLRANPLLRARARENIWFPERPEQGISYPAVALSAVRGELADLGFEDWKTRSYTFDITVYGRNYTQVKEMKGQVEAIMESDAFRFSVAVGEGVLDPTAPDCVVVYDRGDVDDREPKKYSTDGDRPYFSRWSWEVQVKYQITR